MNFFADICEDDEGGVFAALDPVITVLLGAVLWSLSSLFWFTVVCVTIVGYRVPRTDPRLPVALVFALLVNTNRADPLSAADVIA